MSVPAWQWDETVQRGTDYTVRAQVETYDQQMAVLRDVVADAEKILSLLDLSSDDVLLEVGTGTGAFARVAAGRCRAVVAIDVSPVMISYAAERARDERIGNILFKEAGFLTYEHEGEPVAAVVSKLALHHLPDAWKLIALRRIRGMLREGGKLYLSDVVFPDCAQDGWQEYFQEVVGAMPEDRRAEMASHIRQEYSTFDWMMREMLVRAGFSLESVELEGSFLGHYLCRRL